MITLSYASQKKTDSLSKQNNLITVRVKMVLIAQSIQIVLISFYTSFAFVKSEKIATLSCDFDDGDFCNYTSDNHKWSLESSSEVRSNGGLEGPLKGVDGSGHFLLHNEVDLGTLYSSKNVYLSGDHCVTLDYYLFATKASLTVRFGRHYVFSRDEKSSYVDKWQKYVQTINFEEGDYRFYIFASGVVALDNLMVSRGACLQSADYLSWDFDGLSSNIRGTNATGCDWILLSSSRWPQESWGIGFNYDQTTKSYDKGKFLMRTRAREPFEERITFPQFNPEDGHRCLTFWSRVRYGPWTLVARPVAGNETDEIVLLEGRGDRWLHYRVDIVPVVPMVIIIKVSTSEYSETYFDTFELFKGRCPKPASCDFVKDLCGYILDRYQNAPQWLVGHGRVAAPEVYGHGHVLQDHGERFAYVDFSHIYDSEFAIDALQARLTSD